MECTSPIEGYYSKTPNENGRYSIVFDPKLGQVDNPVTLSCGNCIGCRLRRSRMWGLRCMHEASLHSDNIFVTLTYSDEHLPPNADLYYPDFQNFMKRLRKEYVPKNPYNRKTEPNDYKDWAFANGIRFYMCGEYGDNTGESVYMVSKLGRPHFHAILFNHTFSDMEHYETRDGNDYYVSDTLDRLWGKSDLRCIIGECNMQTASYVARYCTKKINGDLAYEHYTRMDPDSGEIFPLRPEFTNMSKFPGIGANFFLKYHQDFAKDFITHDGEKYPVPKYYDKLLEDIDDGFLAQLKSNRALAIDPDDPERSRERLEVKKIIQAKTLTKLPRN